MHTQTNFKLSLYDQLLTLPQNLIGEILNGRLIAQPRPSWPHSLAGSRLGADIEGPYGRARGGPGGWWIIDEPEVHLVLDELVLVPDIAGWRKERMPSPPEGHKIQVVPNWICEILSPTTKQIYRREKMPLYAEYRVDFAWLVDPKAHTLEAYQLVDAQWALLSTFQETDRVSIAPFDAIEIRLEELWAWQPVGP